MDSEYRIIVRTVEDSCKAKIAEIGAQLQSERELHTASLDSLRKTHRRELKKLRRELEAQTDNTRDAYESQFRKLERSVARGIRLEGHEHFDYVRMRNAWLLAEFQAKELRQALMDVRGGEVEVRDFEFATQYPCNYPSPSSPLIVRPTDG